MIDAHRQRVFLAQIAARLVDHRQAVGVRVLAEGDVVAPHRSGDAGEVFGGRLGQVLEAAVGLAAQEGDAAAQFLQEPPAEDAARPVVRVQDDAELPPANRRHVDQCQDPIEVGRDRIGDLLGAAEAVVADPVDRPAAVPVQDPLAGSRGNDPPLGREELQAVVLGWVVAGGDLHATGGLERADKDPCGGGSGDAGVQGRSAHGAEAGMDRFGQHPAGVAAIAGDYQRPRGALGSHRGDIADGHFGRERLAHNPPQAGDTNDWFGHSESIGLFQ